MPTGSGTTGAMMSRNWRAAYYKTRFKKSEEDWGKMAEQVDRDLLWKQYSMHVDLYKSYLDITIKLNAFHYAITGAILSVYLAQVSKAPLLKWSLILPIGLSIGLVILFIYGARLLEN